MACCCSKACGAECQHHFCRRPSNRQAFATSFTIVSFLAVFSLVVTGVVQTAATAIGTLGWEGQLIFVAYIMYTGLVFGYGYGFCCAACGYTYGWWALVPIEIATLFAAALGYAVSRWCMRGTVERKVASLPPHWVARLRLLRSEVNLREEGSLVGYLFLSGLLRNSVVLTFGITTAIDAVVLCVSLPQALLGAMVSSQPGIVLQVYLGALVRDIETAVAASAAGAAANSTGNATDAGAEVAAQTWALVAQVLVVVLFMLGTALWSRSVLKRVGARLDAEHDSAQPRVQPQGQAGSPAPGPAEPDALKSDADGTSTSSRGRGAPAAAVHAVETA